MSHATATNPIPAIRRDWRVLRDLSEDLTAALRKPCGGVKTRITLSRMPEHRGLPCLSVEAFYGEATVTQATFAGAESTFDIEGTATWGPGREPDDHETDKTGLSWAEVIDEMAALFGVAEED